MFRRGFKSQCERRSVELRRSLGLLPNAPLAAFTLAAHLGVKVWSGIEVPKLPVEDRDHLFGPAKYEWSEFVIFERGRHLIVFNPTHSSPRINSDIMHELSHILLGHELTYSSRTEDGYLLNGNYDKAQEDEANWLGGTLLLPRPALLWLRARRLSDAAAVEHFGVSLDMLKWRIRMTGVDYQLKWTG